MTARLGLSFDSFFYYLGAAMLVVGAYTSDWYELAAGAALYLGASLRRESK